MERNRSTYSDTELMQLLRENQQWAFEWIYNEHWEHLYNHAYKRIGIQYIVEDALQNVFGRIWLKRTTLDIANFRAYLTTAMMHECIHILAENKQVDAFYEKFEQLEEVLDDEGYGRMLQKELLEVAHQYAQTLSEKKKQLFLLHLKGYDTKEISMHLKLSRKTVQNQLGIILKNLKNSGVIHLVLLFEVLKDIF